jgi:two-component system cell cycle sensor histidine kinase/response regulator CckA
MMLLNLAVNARDAMPDGGRLRIEVETTDATERLEARGHTGPAAPHVCVTVRDTGQGMDAAVRERVFEPFFTSKPVGKGTGLGLATVASIVEQMGGVIWVDSEPGQGACFTMVFERAEGAIEEALESARARPAAGRGQHILVVEDQENVRQVVRQVLEAAGYELTTTSGPRAALRWAETVTEPPRLILTDVVMPGMNGATMVTHLRQRWPSVPVLFMSGYDPEGLASRARGLERSRFVSKPVTPDALLAAVEECLDPAP